MRKPITCPLAGHLDLDERIDEGDLAERVLVLYADAARGGAPTEALAAALREQGMVVEVAAADLGAAPPPQDYDAVVLVAPLRMWGYARSLTDYMREHVDALHDMPAWFISISRAGGAIAQRVCREAGWCPPGTASFDATVLEPRAHELAKLISDDIPALERAR